ncbi:sugar ABC transporter substrate-binding protein [Nocardiopsis salina]|uniref:sugar ABC transporter substrate-binding protein n=1 Tax=Nocardiopsis salina TaxID=245836 RepID=UPI00034609D5|nr:sugar ABC transporter substrate-binding protein [Nocardiopsis salina]
MARRPLLTHAPLPAAALALVLATTSCGTAEDDTLTVWIMEGTNPDATGFFEEANEAFSEEHGMDVEVEFIPWADAQDMISTSIAGGTMPDVVELGTTFVPEFSDAGALHDLAPAIDDTSAYNEGMLEMGEIDDAVYSLPWYAAIRSVVYRTDVFEEHGAEEPENWEELRETALELSEAEDDMIAFPVPGDAQYSVLPWIWGGGAEVAVEQDDGTWVSEVDSEEAREGIEFFTDLSLEDDLSTTGAVNWNEIDVMESFSEEDAVMAILGNANPKAVVENNPDLEGDIGVFPIPGQDEGYSDSFAGGSNLAVFEGTGNEDAGTAYIEHLTDPEWSVRWADDTGFFPGGVEEIEEYAESDDPTVQPFAVQLNEAGRGTPVAPEWGQVEAENVIVGMQQDILNGNVSVEEATESAADEIEQILNGG